MRASRFFVFCYNATPEFAATFKLHKSDDVGEFYIKYMEAAFEKETQHGEFFIEFEDKIWNTKLIEGLQSHGGCQICVDTFANNDGGESASNALVRILTQQNKTKIEYTRGTCPPALYTKVHAKLLELNRQDQQMAKEFDEKTMAAIKLSLEQQQEVMVKVEGGLQSQAVELNGIKNDVQSQVVKLDGIENGVCNVIPDYQNEIKTLKEALAKKTSLCDTVEGKLAHKTRMINQQNDYITKLEDQHKSHLLEQLAWSRQGAELQSKITALQEQLDTSRNLQQMLEQARLTAEILSATLAEERAAKRLRA